jgi:hypothetical protein
MSLLPDLRKRLQDAGFTGTPIALGRYPATPDAIVVLRDLGNPPPKDHDANNRPATATYRVLLTVRVAKDAGAGAALDIARNALLRLAGRHVDVTRGATTTRYHFIRPVVLPYIDGYDANDRPEITAVLLVERAERLEV